MIKPAYLVLENGIVFEGEFFGAQGEITGEVVFTTGMTGYLETLTDPSYHGQIVLQTFPLIGNYGVIPADFESNRIGPAAYIVRYPCQDPSNFRSEGDLGSFLYQSGIIGICNIDTRALTKIIREQGVMNAAITANKPNNPNLAAIAAYKIQDPLTTVSCKEPVLYRSDVKQYTVAVLDFGIKTGINRALLNRGCDVWLLPATTSAAQVLALAPDGIMLSNGPGNPADYLAVIEQIKILATKSIPLFGICLGHQLLALAHGFKTEKLKYGHRGANQPVKDLTSGHIYITSQNHGYAVIAASIEQATAEQWFINVNDQTCEGIRYHQRPAMSVQFHPEACAGPQDTGFLFDQFIQAMEVYKHAAR